MGMVKYVVEAFQHNAAKDVMIVPIYIGYEQDSRRLAMFSGISNLRDDRGEPQNVLITYEYH